MKQQKIHTCTVLVPVASSGVCKLWITGFEPCTPVQGGLDR